MTELFGNLIKNSGGFKKALKEVGKSLLGPAGLIAAISILIAYAPEIISFFKDAFQTPAQRAKRDVEKLSGELKTLRDDYFGNDTVEDKILSKWDEIIVAQQKYLDNLHSAKDESFFESIIRNILPAGLGGPSVSESIQDKDIGELQQTINKAARDRDAKAIEEGKKTGKKGGIAAAKAFTSEFNNWLADILDPDAAVEAKAKAYGKALADVMGDVTFEDAFGQITDKVALAKPGKIIDPNDVEVLNEDDLDLFGNFEQDIPDPKPATDFFDKIGGASVVAAGLITSFNSALNAQGTGGFEAFAKSVIQVAQQIAFAMAIAAATKDSVKTSAVLLPALIGVALGVVSSAFGKIGSPSGSRGGGGVAATTTPSVTPSRIQGFGDSGQLVATVRGQDLRFMLQGANDSYNARN